MAFAKTSTHFSCQLARNFKTARIPDVLLNRYCSRISNIALGTQSMKTDTEASPGPGLEHFLSNSDSTSMGTPRIASKLRIRKTESPDLPYLSKDSYRGNGRKVYFETYGCQMNVNDTEIALAVLEDNGFVKTSDIKKADVIFIMTCSIREGAERKIWSRIDQLNVLKRQRSKSQYPLTIAILGCMAERLKTDILDKRKAVDIVCGPDAYKDLPRLLSITSTGQTAVNVMLSLDETYADVMPVRINQQSTSAFVSIMRGCENMCSYCIVPFTRGRERSRPVDSITDEVSILRDQGIKEVTLLGQNVNSYRDLSQDTEKSQPTKMAKGFKTVYKTKVGGLRFADLLDQVSRVDPEIRIRFTSPHPKDFPDEVLQLINERPNICKQIHIPAQSGSTPVLEYMRRGYSAESYIELIDHIKSTIPDVRLSSDFIAGFCGETEEDHEKTLSLLSYVRYHRVFHFPYSMREKTHAHRKLKDDVPEEVKLRRHTEIGDISRRIQAELNTQEIGSVQLVLIEGDSKRSTDDFMGRHDGNTKVIFPKSELLQVGKAGEVQAKPGDYVAVKILSGTSETVKGEGIFITSLDAFNSDLEKYKLSMPLATHISSV